MKTKLFIYPVFALGIALSVASCGKKESEDAVEIHTSSLNYTGDQAVKVRDQTVIELLAIKKEVKETIDEHRSSESLDSFVSDLESLRSRLDYLQMQTAMLPKKEQMVIYGNLAAATNQLEKDLLAMLAKAPGNDDLAVEVANLREKLSPIPLGSMLQKY